MINRSNRSANVSYTAEELLSHLINSGRINTDDVVNDLLMKERNDVLKAHPYAISQGKDERWRTFVKDKRYKSGRKMIAKSTRKGVEDALYDFYIDHDESERLRRMTILELYPKWLEHKTIHTTAETYVTRIESDWKTYYENDEIIDRRIASLKRLDLDEWAHKLIRKYDMTKNAYYNVTMIMRQCLQYAVDLDIIESSPFDNVKIDGRRMFRSVHKKPDETQVYTDEEVEKIFELAWNDFYSSDRLIYRLAPLALMFQFQTGLRIGELCAVKHSDVRNGRIHISRMLRRDTNEVVEHTKSHDETVVLLSRKNIDDHLEFTWTDEEFGNKGCKATYPEIQAYIQEKYGFKVSHLNIAQMKRKCGIIERENYNLKKSEKSKQPGCTPEKEKAIIDAFKHFQMI